MKIQSLHSNSKPFSSSPSYSKNKMNVRQLLKALAIAGLVAGVSTSTAHAAVVQVVTTNTRVSGVGPEAGFHAGTIQALTDDLLQTQLASATANTTTGLASLTSGKIGLNTGAFTATDPDDPDARFQGGVSGNYNPAAPAASASYVVFNLDTSVNTLGYDITQIRVMTSWTDLRALQDWVISYSLVGSAAFTRLHWTGNNVGASNTTGLVSLTDNSVSGLLAASGVDAIRFDFYETTSATGKWSAYREIDVVGTAVPEPGSLALMGLGGLCLLRRRRA